MNKDPTLQSLLPNRFKARLEIPYSKLCFIISNTVLNFNSKKFSFSFLSLFFFFFFFWFLRLHLCIWRFSGKGCNLSCSCQLQPQPQQRQIRAPSVTYTSVHGNTGPLNHWVKPRIKLSSHGYWLGSLPLSHSGNSRNFFFFHWNFRWQELSYFSIIQNFGFEFLPQLHDLFLVFREKALWITAN